MYFCRTKSLIDVVISHLTLSCPSVPYSMSSSPSRYVVWESEGLVAYLNPRPWTPGSVILESRTPGSPGGSIFHLNQSEYLTWLLGARAVAELLCDRLGVRRCALVSRPHRDRPAEVRSPLLNNITVPFFCQHEVYRMYFLG